MKLILDLKPHSQKEEYDLDLIKRTLNTMAEDMKILGEEGRFLRK